MARKQKMGRDIDVRAAVLASQFARMIGLPAGNLWEPPIARNIANDMRKYPGQMAEVGAHWAFRLGLASHGIPSEPFNPKL